MPTFHNLPDIKSKILTSTKNKISLLLKIQLLSAVCSTAYAQEVTISDTRESSITTSTANNGSAADIIITDEGQISIENGTVITVDSDNSVYAEGSINNPDLNSGIGIKIDTGSSGTLNSDIYTESGISVGTIDDDGNVGSNNYGILVTGNGIFQGDIVTESPSTISVFGENSAAVSLQTDMVGLIELNGVSVTGENSNAIEILGTLDGDLQTKSTITALEANNHGVYIGGDISGSYNNLGSITTGGSITYDDDGNEVPAPFGIASVRISSNLGEGFINDIAFQNEDGDQINVLESDTSDDFFLLDTSYIEAKAGGYALWITPEKDGNSNWTDITLGGSNSFYGDYGIVNQGTIRATGINSGKNITAINISGAKINNDIFTTTITNGFYNGRWATIGATAIDATATGINIGDYAYVPEFINNGTFEISTAVTTDDDGEVTGAGGSAYGLIVAPNAEMMRFENNGSFTVNAAGYNDSSYGLVDKSGTIEEFINTGAFTVDIWDDSSGETIAIDLSENITGVDFFNSGQIFGDVYLGSGDNTVTLEGLTAAEKSVLVQEYEDLDLLPETYEPYLERLASGTLYLGNGSTTLTMADDSQLLGGIYSPNGQLDINLLDQSELTIPSDLQLNVNNLLAEDNSTIFLKVNAQDDFIGGINATGAVTFAGDSQLKIGVESVIFEESQYQIINAAAFSISDANNILSAGNQLFIYDVSTEVTDTSLSVGLRRKDGNELGLTSNLAQIYDASISALLQDPEVASAVSRSTNLEEFSAIYNAMMPNSLTQANRQMVINSSNLSVGAVAGQLDNLRHMQKSDSRIAGDRGAWVQQYGSLYDQQGEAGEKSASGFTFGLSAGYEFVSSKRGTLGVSISRGIANAAFDGQNDQNIVLDNTQLGIYGGLWLDNFFLQSQANFGLLHFDSVREIIFEDFTRNATAEWGGNQYSTSFKGGYELNLGPISLTPTAGLSYMNFKQNSYTEIDGGTAINLSVDDHKTTSFASDLNLELAYTKNFPSSGTLRLGANGGWKHEFNTDPTSISVNFAEFEENFSLTGSPIIENNYKAGASAYFYTDITAFSLKYDAEWKEQYLEHSASMNFRVWF